MQGTAGLIVGMQGLPRLAVSRWWTTVRHPSSGEQLHLVKARVKQAVMYLITNDPVKTEAQAWEVFFTYRRRWQIELAFLTLKELFGLHHWWSSQLALILQQIAVVLLLAQAVQALRLQVAEQAGCDPFDVSLPLFVKHLPHLLHAGQRPLDWVLTYGKTQHVLRPSSRYQVVALLIPPEHLTPLPPDLVLIRKARYITYQPRPARRSSKKKSSKKTPAPSKPPPSQKAS